MTALGYIKTGEQNVSENDKSETKFGRRPQRKTQRTKQWRMQHTKQLFKQ
jgi:hypothetical protein